LNLCIGQILIKRIDAETIVVSIQKRLNDLQIASDNEPRIAYIVGDSALVNQAMVRAFNRHTGQQSMFRPCSAHALNNIMQMLWSAVCPDVSELMAVIETIRNPAKFCQMAQEYQPNHPVTGQEKCGHPTTIASAISVRWYSLEKMFSSAINLRLVIEKHLSDARDPRLRTRLLVVQWARSAPMVESPSFALDS
jgi:hypothetical protein